MTRVNFGSRQTQSCGTHRLPERPDPLLPREPCPKASHSLFPAQKSRCPLPAFSRFLLPSSTCLQCSHTSASFIPEAVSHPGPAGPILTPRHPYLVITPGTH